MQDGFLTVSVIDNTKPNTYTITYNVTYGSYHETCSNKIIIKADETQIPSDDQNNSDGN